MIMYNQLFSMGLEPNEETFAILLDPSHYNLSNSFENNLQEIKNWLDLMMNGKSFESLPVPRSPMNLTWKTKIQLVKWCIWIPKVRSIDGAFRLLMRDKLTFNDFIEILGLPQKQGSINRFLFFKNIRAKILSLNEQETWNTKEDSFFYEQACLLFLNYMIKSIHIATSQLDKKKLLYPQFCELVLSLLLKKGLKPTNEILEAIATSWLAVSNLQRAKIYMQNMALSSTLASELIRFHSKNNDLKEIMLLLETHDPCLFNRNGLSLLLVYLINYYYRFEGGQKYSHNDLILKIFAQFCDLGPINTKKGPTKLYSILLEYFIDTKQLLVARKVLIYSYQDQIFLTRNLLCRYFIEETKARGDGWRPDILPWHRYPIASLELYDIDLQNKPMAKIGDSSNILPKTLKSFHDGIAHVVNENSLSKFEDEVDFRFFGSYGRAVELSNLFVLMILACKYYSPNLQDFSFNDIELSNVLYAKKLEESVQMILKNMPEKSLHYRQLSSVAKRFKLIYHNSHD